ncbi:hypothetical protein JTE90_024189 [Oedothorax gibbosus]|uniref:Uncharacterized protein n=1 Tax=Oedothorax gibbosus TaxID=931172 RepID=A0AAV6UDX3_9ARAC|nr:hypothetical protein JTE90_024189 [Oedothorax gibbosus]
MQSSSALEPVRPACWTQKIKTLQGGLKIEWEFQGFIAPSTIKYEYITNVPNLASRFKIMGFKTFEADNGSMTFLFY